MSDKKSSTFMLIMFPLMINEKTQSLLYNALSCQKRTPGMPSQQKAVKSTHVEFLL